MIDLFLGVLILKKKHESYQREQINKHNERTKPLNWNHNAQTWKKSKIVREEPQTFKAKG